MLTIIISVLNVRGGVYRVSFTDKSEFQAQICYKVIRSTSAHFGSMLEAFLELGYVYPLGLFEEVQGVGLPFCCFNVLNEQL